ncbi:MAG TPA: DMT family transporter [Anaerolineaceae bacterium]|nr:DMT family transporter [Anaerolineaceae bacterium]
MRNSTATELTRGRPQSVLDSDSRQTACAAEGAIFVVLAAIGFSTKAILVKLAYVQQIDAVTLLTLRMGFSLPFFIVMGVWGSRHADRLKLRSADGFAVLALGLLGYYVANMLDFFGLELICAGLERLIVSLYPTLVVMFSYIVFGRSIHKMEIVALVTCYVGAALILYRQIDFRHPAILWGSTLVFGSAVAYAVYLIGSHRFITRLGPYRFTALGMAVACIACLVQFALTHPFSALDVSNEAYLISASMALFSTVMPSLLLSLGIQRIGPSQASLVSSVGPVSALVLANLVLGETMSGIEELLGSGLVLMGVFAISLKKHQVAST